MRAAWLLAALSFLLSPVPASSATGDEEAVTQVIRQMYVALAQEDDAKLRALTAPDFYCYDVGKRYTGDELMTAIRNAHAAGKTFAWNVMDARVRLEGNVAWATWVNRGHVQDAAGKKEVTWLESAVLLKEGGTWRIQFFHSTRAAGQ